MGAFTNAWMGRRKKRPWQETAGTGLRTMNHRKAVEEYRRQRLLDEANAAYSALRGDEREWQEELVERRDWEATLPDGLDDA